MKTFKTMNYCLLPEDKWLLVDLLYNITQKLYISHSSVTKISLVYVCVAIASLLACQQKMMKF